MLVKIDVVASEPHYLKHMVPIWAALPEALRGNVHPLYDQGAAQRPPMGRWALVAGWQDVAPLRGQCNMIYVEHGAGQTYVDRPHDPSYSGSRGQRHRGVVGYIAPSRTVADRWDKPAAAVGCPKMDEWLDKPKGQLSSTQPTVEFAWHWDCSLVPETRSAWPHYAPWFDEIARRFTDQGFNVFQHQHPKWRRDEKAPTHTPWGICNSEEGIFRYGDILIVDNSSLAYEFALLGRPVICLNAPWYRRDVEHGLRFWSHVPGIQIDDPEELLSLNLWDLLNDTTQRGECLTQGARAVEHAYAYRDGSSSVRAAAFIASLMGAE